MRDEQTNQILNRLLVVHSRSLPCYLGYATPWWDKADGAAAAMLAQIIDDNTQIADRLSELILRRNGVVSRGSFPMRFTAYHDLSFDYLLDRMLESQRNELAHIEQCSSLLTEDPEAHALAEEALGMARGHLESLEELAAGEKA